MIFGYIKDIIPYHVEAANARDETLCKKIDKLKGEINKLKKQLATIAAERDDALRALELACRELSSYKHPDGYINDYKAKCLIANYLNKARVNGRRGKRNENAT